MKWCAGKAKCLAQFILKVASVGDNAQEEVVEHEIDLDETLKARVNAHLEAWRTDILHQAADIIEQTYRS